MYLNEFSFQQLDNYKSRRMHDIYLLRKEEIAMSNRLRFLSSTGHTLISEVLPVALNK